MELFSLSMRKLWKEWNLRVTVLLSLVLQIVLITLGNRRKHNHKLWISIVVWCVYLSADVIATFGLGIITNNVSDIYDEEGGSMDANTELTAFWAPFLLLHLGGPDTITAYALEDNELWLRHFLGLAVQTGMAIYVFIMAWTSSLLSILYLLMFVAGLIKYGERTWVLRKASIETIRESIADDGINISSYLNESESPSATTYGPDRFNTELFVAYGLVRIYFGALILNVDIPRISGYNIESFAGQDRFKIIEGALGFMYDKLYTKAPLIYSSRGLCLRVITFFLTTSVLVFFPVVVIHDKHKFSNTDVTITYILLVGAIILELYSAVLILSSDRFRVWLIQHENFSTEKALESFLTQKRWSNNMSQFSLLSFIMKEKPLPCSNILKHLRLDKRLEKQWYAAGMEIPNNLKTLIFLYLQRKCIIRNVATDDTTSLVDHVGPDFTEELEKSILAWHVATDIRYELDKEDIKRHGPAFELHCGLICQISRYMFYLLVRHPDMISNGSMDQIILQSILFAARAVQFTDKTVARQRVDELLKHSKRYLKMHNLVEPSSVDGDVKKFLKDRLPRLLRILYEQGFEERWKIISWIWLEMLPYAAITCRGIQHAQHLKNGGEFLTHVWFLVSVLLGLTHKDFTSHPSANPILFDSVMPLLNRPGRFGIPGEDTNPRPELFGIP